MLALYVPALAVAFVITMIEMTEVVALVFALSADHASVAHGAAGAVAGCAVVALVALGSGALLLALPRDYLLGPAAITLAAFGVFLFRSTLRSYRRARAPPGTAFPPSRSSTAVQFAGGFSVGVIESTEVVVVLLAIAAAGYGSSALVGALAGGAVLVGAALAVNQQIRRIKVPWLKWGATSMLFTFSIFWAGEAAGVAWPGDDLFLVPMFLAGLGIVRAGIEGLLRRTTPRTAPA